MDQPDELKEPRPPSRKKRWRNAFIDYCQFLPAEDVVHCPECDATTLKVLASADPISRDGMCHFWCDTCLIGIQLFRIIVPDKIEIPTDTFGSRLAAMPPYRVVM